MNEGHLMEPWLGICHFVRNEDETQENSTAVVAVFCADREAFDAAVREFVTDQSIKHLWSEEVHQAGQWIARHPKERVAAGLARTVHADHRVEMGKLSPVLKDGANPVELDFLSVTEHEIITLPDPTGVSHWEREWIAPQLKDLLFGQAVHGPKLRTYLILDATLRKNITGVFDLDSGMVDVPVKCLFKGEAAEEMKENAPYLLDVTLPEGAMDDQDLVPGFHRSFFAKHWGHNTGIFIRTTALMGEVWSHFRKFPRIQVEEDKRWVFFRFWDPRIAAYYFVNIKGQKERIQRIFTSDAGSTQFSVFAENYAGVVEMRPNETMYEEANVAPPAFVFNSHDFQIFKDYVVEKFILDVAERAAELWPHRRKVFETPSLWTDEIRKLTEEAQKLALKSDRDIRDYISITLDKGKPFWQREDVAKLLAQPHLNTPTLKILAVRNKLETGVLA